MPKYGINFLASPTRTVLTPAPHVVFCEKQIPSCISLSKPIAQHFHYLSAAERDLSTADTPRCGLSVCCVPNHICLSGGFGFAAPLCGFFPVLGFGGLWDVQWLCCSSGEGSSALGRLWAPRAGGSQEQPGWVFWRCLQAALCDRGALRLWKAVSRLCEWTGLC